MNFNKICLTGRVVTEKTIQVQRSHLKYMKYFDGTKQGFQNIVELFINHGKQKSYLKVVLATLIRKRKHDDPKWINPVDDPIEYKNLITNPYRTVQKLRSNRGYKVYDANGNIIEHGDIPLNIQIREKTIAKDKLDVILKHIYASLNADFYIDVDAIKKYKNEIKINAYATHGTNSCYTRYLNYEYLIIFVSLYYSAARVSEIKNLLLGDFETFAVSGTITIYGKTGTLCINIPNGLKYYLNKFLLIAKQIHDNDLKAKVFMITEGKLNQCFTEMYESIFNEPKPLGVGFGVLRKNQAARLYNLNPLSAQLALNHSNISTTEHKYMKHAIHSQGLVQLNIDKLYEADRDALLHGFNKHNEGY